MTTEKVCEKCGGTGKIVVDETTHRMCICLFNRKMREHLGKHGLATAKPVFDGPLYQQVFDAKEGNLPTVDLTGKNLFIKSWWDDLIGHMTWAFYCKGLNWYFQVVTDERIRTVFVGNEHYASKRRSRREEEESNNSLHDLIGGDSFDLVIIRLGFLGYKNVAMAGALLEALRIREVKLKPTWIVEEPNSVFAPGHFSYSEELSEYIHRRFETIDMVQDRERTAEPRGVETSSAHLESDEGMGIDDDRVIVEALKKANEVVREIPGLNGEQRVKVKTQIAAAALDVGSMSAVFGPSSSQKKGGYGKKGGGGGSPV